MFVFHSVTAQKTTNGKITYKVELVNNQKKIDSLSKVNPNSSVVEILKTQKPREYELFFNDSVSLSQIKERMNSEAFNGIDLVALHLGKSSKFYTYKKKRLILNEKESMGESFILSQHFLKWKLINRKKKIGKYTVYMATTEKEIISIKGSIKRKITAWYCPEIPIGFGPREFSGLPGLILELEEGSLNFKAEKIELNSNRKIKIKTPTKGKRVTLDEYNNFAKKKALNFKKRRGF